MIDVVDELKEIIKKLHHCSSAYLESVLVKEVFQNQTVWEGQVEVFLLINHPKANKCYVWEYIDDEGDQQFTTVLGIPPVDNAQKAVQVAIAGQFKNEFKN